MKTLVVSAMCALLAATSTACGSSGTGGSVSEDCTPEHEFSTVQQGKLTVIAVASMPYVDVDPVKGEAEGIDAELLGAFAAQECLTVEWKAVNGATAIETMRSGKGDVGAGGWYRTPERGEVLGQTDPVWYDFNAVISTDGYSTIKELEGKTVGVVAGSLYVKPLQQAIGKNNLRQYQLADGVLRDLSSGRIDAAVLTTAEAGYQIKQRDLTELQLETLSPDPAHPKLTSVGEPNYPHPKDNTALGTALDDFIEQARRDGTVKETLAEYGITDEKNLNKG